MLVKKLVKVNGGFSGGLITVVAGFMGLLGFAGASPLAEAESATPVVGSSGSFGSSPTELLAFSLSAYLEANQRSGDSL